MQAKNCNSLKMFCEVFHGVVKMFLNFFVAYLIVPSIKVELQMIKSSNKSSSFASTKKFK